jgi:ankyrin repeat protein
MTRWGKTALHQALLRDNTLATVEAMLDRGADPGLETNGASAVALAARRGRGDVLGALEGRGVPIALGGVDALLAACASDDTAAIQSATRSHPDLVRGVIEGGGQVLAEFAGTGNAAGVGHLLDLGIDVNARFEAGDGYWDVAERSTALHVAAWRARHAVVELLIERGAAVDARDGKGRTPLALAVRACVDSHWKEFRSPSSVELLLRGGASVDSVRFPSGYAEVDELLRSHGARAPGRPAND